MFYRCRSRVRGRLALFAELSQLCAQSLRIIERQAQRYKSARLVRVFKRLTKALVA